MEALTRSSSLLPLRVLHIINGEHFSGGERVQDLLALGLQRQGIEVGFAFTKQGRFAISRTSIVPLFEVPMRAKLDFRAARHIAKIVREGRYSLIHTHTPRTALVGRIASHLAKVPMIYHVHSPARFDTENSWKNWLNATSEYFSLKNAAALITVSNRLKDYMLQEGFPAARIHVVPNGVPVGSPLGPWRLPENRPWEIGMAAVFRPRKGLEILLDAIWQLRSAGANIHLRAVGPFESAAYEARVHQYVKIKGLEDIIQWVGYSQNINVEFARMDIFVLPSLYGEGLPMILLEAMAAGVPIIAAEIDGVSEVIRHGIDGLLFKPGDAGSLVGALQAIIKGGHSPEALRQSAYARQSHEFSDEHMTKAVADIYRKVLGA